MRDRLIELIKQKSCVYAPCDNECGGCKNVEMYDDSIESITDYLLANGVIAPPCKVGDKIFAYIGCGTIIAAIVTRIETTETPSGTERNYFAIGSESPSVTFNDECIGKTVFLTKEEAERALKGGVQE